MGCCPSKEQEPANQRQTAQKAPQKPAKIADPKKEPLLQHEHTATPQMPDTTIFDTTNHHSGSSDEKERDHEKTPAKPNNSDDKSQKNGTAEQIKVSGQKPVRIEVAAPAEVPVQDIQVSHVIFEAPKPPLESLKPIIEENPPEMENLFSSSITEKRPAEDLVEQETEKESEEPVDHPGRKPDSAPIIYDAATGITSQGTYYPDPEDQRKYVSSFLPVVEQPATDDHAAQEIHENGVADPTVSADHFVQNETVIVDTQGPVETSHETQAENLKSEIPESQERPDEEEVKKEDSSDENKQLEVSEFLGVTKTQEMEVSLLVPAVQNEHVEVSELVPEAHTEHDNDATEPKETEEKEIIEESAEVGHPLEDKSADPVDVVPEPAESTADKPVEISAEVVNQPTDDQNSAAADPKPEDPIETPEETPEPPKTPQQSAPLMADSGVFKSAAELTDSVFEEVVARKEPTNTNPEDPNHLFMSTVSELPAEPKAEPATAAEITESVVDFGTSSAVFGDSTDNAQPGQTPTPEADQPAE